MREIKFSIILQHEETGRIVNRLFSYADIFNGTAKDEISRLKGYAIIARRQFTGLLDKNSKEIYEGDIISYKYSYPKGKPFVVEFGTQEFADSNYQEFCIGYNLNPTANEYYEIISNIYETPHLLDIT